MAFFHAQQAWRGDLKGFAWQGWWQMIMQIVMGFNNWKYGYIQQPWHPLLFLIIMVSGYLLYHFRLQLGFKKVHYGFYFLWLLMWLLAGDELFKVVIVFGGIYLLWFFRYQIPLVTFVYGLCSYGLILNTGITPSAERYA